MAAEDNHDEIAVLFALTVDELRRADNANDATAALRKLWERVEDPPLLREAVEDRAWGDLLPMFGER